jgi:competence protein ComGC
MFVNFLRPRVLLAIASCLLIILLPLSGGAQNVIKKGAQGVQKGVETGVEKTKEGA